MIRHVLTGPLADALAERQAAFELGGAAEEWLLPGGEHELPAGVALGAAGRELAIVGRPDTTLRLAAGGLAVRGERVRMATLAVATAGPGPADGGRATALAVDATVAELTGVRCSARGDEAIGLWVRAEDEAMIADCLAHDVRGGASAVGIAVTARAIELTGIEVRDARGDSCDGVVLVSPGAGDVLALDVTARALEARAGLCRGVAVAAAGPVRLRGFSAAGLQGVCTHGVVVVGASTVELASGRVDGARGSGMGAVGVRVLATDPESAVAVHDLAIEAIGGSSPRADARPHEDLATWATLMAAALRTDVVPSASPLAGLPSFPDGPARTEVVGLHVGAGVDALGWLRAPQPAGLHLEDIVAHRIAGTALQVEGELRPAELRRIELWTSARAGWLQAENLLLAEATVHRHLEPVRFGPGNVRVLDALFSGVAGSAAPALDDEAELVEVAAAFAAGAAPPWRPLDELPYRNPGPATAPASLADGVRPPAIEIDLALRADAAVADTAVAVDGDRHAPFVGARAPDAAPPCHLDDPQPRAWRPPSPAWPADPVADYRARDADALLSLMLERARVTMVPWTEGDPSDVAQMLFELLAERLDHLAYEQERAVAEGFLERARMRRSVEDHARPLDYQPDPGLSATTMLRFLVDRDARDRAASVLAPDGTSAAVDLIAAMSDGRPLEIPAGTVVGNGRPDERSILFATESLLTYLPELDVVPLAEPVPVGATRARLRGRFARLERDRWLVLSRGPAFPGLVLRTTAVQLETDTTLIAWDPRRPTLHAYPADTADGDGAVVFGNVIPGHHGLPVEVRGGGAAGAALDPVDPLDRALERWREALRIRVDGSRAREIELPLRPSIHAAGYPLPGQTRRGRRALRVAVDGDPWTEVDDLSRCGPGDEVFAVRASSSGLPVLRFGDGANGAALPGRWVDLDVELTVGSGAAGNVGAFTLDQLVRFGRVGSDGSDPEAMILPTGGPTRDDLVRSIWQVTNPLPAVGGRDPEPLESIRYRAPLGVRDALSAVTPADYERLLMALPYVAGARARAVDAGVRDLVQVTVLLRDEDTLPEPELLRRWALVRRTLEEIRLLGFDVEAVPPAWVPLDIDLVVDALPHAEPGRLRDDVTEALAGNGGLLDPDTVGLGGDVRLSELYQAVQRVPGVGAVRVLRFRRLAPHAREHLTDGVIPVADHEVATLGGPRAPGTGLLTISVCGGLA